MWCERKIYSETDCEKLSLPCELPNLEVTCNVEELLHRTFSKLLTDKNLLLTDTTDNQVVKLFQFLKLFVVFFFQKRNNILLVDLIQARLSWSNNVLFWMLFQFHNQTLSWLDTYRIGWPCGYRCYIFMKLSLQWLVIRLSSNKMRSHNFIS